MRSADYHLSMALRYQTRARQALFARNHPLSLSLYQDSVREFENYFLCAKDELVPAEVHLNSAISYMELGEYEKAERQLEFSLSKNGRNREAIITRARLLIRQGRLEDAEKFLEQKITHSPEDSDILFLLGSLNKETGRYNKATLYFTSLYDSIMRRNGNPRYKIHVLKNLGDIYYQKGDAKKSLYYYQGYIVLNPTDTNVKFQIAQIFNILGDFGASRKILQSIHTENPGDKHVELLLAEMHFVESRKTSYPFLKKLYREGKIPKDHLVHALYSVLREDWNASEEFLREFLPKHENRIAARLAWIEVLRNRYSAEQLMSEYKKTSELAYSIRQFQLAYNLSTKLLELQMQNNSPPEEVANTYLFLSNCMDEKESPNRSILYAKKSIQIAPNPTDKEKYQLHLAQLLLSDKVKRYDESLRLIDTILARNPKNSQAFYVQAYAYYMKKKYNESLESILKAIEKDPSNPSYFFFRGMIYEKLGNIEGVEEDMLKVIEINPGNPAPYNYLGYLLADRNSKLDQALKLIQKAVELEPDNGAYQDSLGWVYFRKNDIENALFHLYLAKQMLEDREIRDYTVYEHLGDVYYVKGEWAIARDYWKKAIGFTESAEDRIRIEKKITGK